MGKLSKLGTNDVWKMTVGQLITSPDFISSPRGEEVREILAGQYTVEMPAFIDLLYRKVNVGFMLQEAYWILSGSNRLSDLTPFIKGYGRFSDDGVTLNGAYGPKVVDQLNYVVSALEKDNDSRQAVLTTWRERPGESKDIPCTVSMQFIIRDGVLYTSVGMRSHDIVLGFTYDVFTFSMISRAVQLLLISRGVPARLGDLTVTAGSLHLYSKDVEKVTSLLQSVERDGRIIDQVDTVMRAKTYENLLERLRGGAEAWLSR